MPVTFEDKSTPKSVVSTVRLSDIEPNTVYRNVGDSTLLAVYIETANSFILHVMWNTEGLFLFEKDSDPVVTFLQDEYGGIPDEWIPTSEELKICIC